MVLSLTASVPILIYLKQSAVVNGFVDFMLDQTQGFTHSGVERLNDSIRTYVWPS